MAIFKRSNLFQTIFLGIHVSFRRCTALDSNVEHLQTAVCFARGSGNTYRLMCWETYLQQTIHNFYYAFTFYRVVVLTPIYPRAPSSQSGYPPPPTGERHAFPAKLAAFFSSNLRPQKCDFFPFSRTMFEGQKSISQKNLQ